MQYVNTCKQESYPSLLCLLLYVFYLFLVRFSVIFSYGKPFWSFVYVIFYCVSAVIFNLMSTFYGLIPYIFCQKMEKARSVKVEMKGELFVSRQNRHVFFVENMIKVFFSICTLNWRVINYVYRQGKGIYRRNESTILIIYDTSTVSFNAIW